MIEFLQREKGCHVKCKFVVQVLLNGVISVYFKLYILLLFVFFSYQSIMLFGFYRVIGKNTSVMIDLNVH